MIRSWSLKACFTIGCLLLMVAEAKAAEELRVKVIASYPHDAAAFTQGLLLEGDVFYESTGLEGLSSLRRVDARTGRVLHKVDLDRRLFGEGLVRLDTRLVQLTWKDGIAIVWDAETLTELERWHYSGEGWGLTFDGNQLIQSDGSSWLTFRDPMDFSQQAKLQVKLDGRPLAELNELEFAEGKLYANVWGSDRIVRIDPSSGEVEATIDAGGLLAGNEKVGTDVLNGIAWDAQSKTFWITGKRWPKMFQVVFERAAR